MRGAKADGRDEGMRADYGCDAKRYKRKSLGAAVRGRMRLRPPGAPPEAS